MTTSENRAAAAIAEVKKAIEDEIKITKLMAETYGYTLTLRETADGSKRIHRVTCDHCGKRFFATATGRTNEKMIQHFENHHARGRLQAL